MKEISIICVLPEEVNNYYLELRQKLEDRFGLELNHSVPAHITFKYGFPIDDFDKIEDVVKEVCLTHTKTMWELHDFGNFIHSNKYVVFIDCIPMKGIRGIHEDLFESLRKINWVKWGEFDTADLHYHVTLASKGITSENFDSVWSFLDRLEKPCFKFQFDNLALFRIERDPLFVSSMFHFPD